MSKQYKSTAMYRLKRTTLLALLALLLAGLLAHNLIREFQMQTAPPCRKTTPKRAALWAFERLGSFRTTILHRAGRLTRPHGRLTLRTRTRITS